MGIFARVLFALALFSLVLIVVFKLSTSALSFVQPDSPEPFYEEADISDISQDAPQAPQDSSTGNMVKAEDVRGWCSDGPDGLCADHKFEELREGPNTIVHMTTAHAVTLRIPDGVFVDAWGPSGSAGCDTTTHPRGPSTIVACEATFRRFSRTASVPTTCNDIARQVSPQTGETELSVSEGTLLHVEFYQPGEPEYEAILSPIQYTVRGWQGMGWAYTGCDEAYVRKQVDAHIQRRRWHAANNGGWANPSQVGAVFASTN